MFGSKANQTLVARRLCLLFADNDHSHIMFLLKPPKVHNCKYQPDSPVPDNILAFRSITMYLSQIQAIQQLPVPPISVESFERNQARISDAFAQLAVAEHDVVAFSARPPNGSSNIDLLACLNRPVDSNQASPEQDSLIYWILDLIFTRNPVRKGPDEVNRGSLPTITSPKKPNNPGADEGVVKYLEQLDLCW